VGREALVQAIVSSVPVPTQKARRVDKPIWIPTKNEKYSVKLEYQLKEWSNED
jgi:hypothetical protein